MARGGKLALLAGARRWAKNNADKVHSGVDRASSAVKDRIASKHSGKVDSGASMLKKALTGTEGAPSGRSPSAAETSSSTRSRRAS